MDSIKQIFIAMLDNIEKMIALVMLNKIAIWSIFLENWTTQ
jgi:hypothetical protein